LSVNLWIAVHGTVEKELPTRTPKAMVVNPAKIPTFRTKSHERGVRYELKMKRCSVPWRWVIVKREFLLGLALVLFTNLGTKRLVGQAKEPARVFKPALDQVQPRTRIPILLPSQLPAAIPEKDIKLAYGTVSKDGYFIALYFSEIGSEAAFAAGFGGSTKLFRDMNMRQVKLANGITGMFSPVSCGGSCAPANLWWEQNGVRYQIQIKLSSTSDEKDQERILAEAANSSVIVRGK
jgi:hypothetical protein